MSQVESVTPIVDEIQRIVRSHEEKVALMQGCYVKESWLIHAEFDTNNSGFWLDEKAAREYTTRLGKCTDVWVKAISESKLATLDEIVKLVNRLSEDSA